MSYRLRRQSRIQADRQLFGGPLKQTTFKGGQNIDRPASEIDEDQIVEGHNVICFDRHIEARPGTRVVGDNVGYSLPGTGDVWAIAKNPNRELSESQPYRRLIMHRGTKVFGFFDPPSFNPGQHEEIALSHFSTEEEDGETFAINGESTIRPYEDGFLLFAKGGLFCIGQNGAYKANAANPASGLTTYPSGGVVGFRRRYLVTLSRIVDSEGATVADRLASGSILVHESGTNGKRGMSPSESPELTDRDVDYAQVEAAEFEAHDFSYDELLACVSSAADADDQAAAKHFTHITIYATKDIWLENIDSTPRKKNISEEYIWLADVRRDAIISDIGAIYTDDTTDAVLDARLASGSFLLKTRGFEPLPGGAAGEVSPGFIFVADRTPASGKNKLCYSQLQSPENAGYYFPGAQFKLFSDRISALAYTQDILTVFCDTSTHICATGTVSTDISKLQFIAVLTHFEPADDTTGVRLWATISKADKNSFVALCSDGTVRVWDTNKWSDDLSYNSVNTEIRRIRAAAGVFYNGAYYLWYSKNTTETELTSVLRLGFGGRGGFGWTFYSDWVNLSTRGGVIAYADDAARNYRLLALNSAASEDETFRANTFYWLESYDVASGSEELAVALFREDRDGVETYPTPVAGTDITCSVKFRELTATEEADFILHEETHIYMRPLDATEGYLSGLEVNFTGYKDGSPVAEDSVVNVPKTGDLHFVEEISGRRIQLELSWSAGTWRLVGIDTHCRSLDRINYETAGADGPGLSQLELSSNLKHWITRA